MPKLEITLDEKLKQNILFDEITVRKITIQLIRGIRDIHKTGYVHCDIKPANILIRTINGSTRLFFIDFGLIEKYSLAGEDMTELCFPRGTPIYMSMNCHRRKKLTRKDDLESILYIVIFMLESTLPWFHLFCPEIAENHYGFTV